MTEASEASAWCVEAHVQEGVQEGGQEGVREGVVSASATRTHVVLGQVPAVPKPKAEAPAVRQPSSTPPRLSRDQWVWLQIGLGVVVLAALWYFNVIRPTSLGGGKGKGGSGGGGGGGEVPWYAWVFAAAVVYLCMGIGAQFAAAQVKAGAWWPFKGVVLDSDQGRALVMLGQCVAGLIAGTAMVALSRGKVSWPPASAWAAGAIAFVVALPVVNATGLVSVEVYKAIQGKTPPSIAHETLETIAERPTQAWVMVLTFCAIVPIPIIEEILYRYFLQNGITRALGSAWWGVLITSAIFAAAHLGSVPVQALPMLFVLGAAFGVAMVRTGSLAVPIVMHVLFNAANVALAVWR